MEPDLRSSQQGHCGTSRGRRFQSLLEISGVGVADGIQEWGGRDAWLGNDGGAGWQRSIRLETSASSFTRNEKEACAAGRHPVVSLMQNRSPSAGGDGNPPALPARVIKPWPPCSASIGAGFYRTSRSFPPPSTSASLPQCQCHWLPPRERPAQGIPYRCHVDRLHRGFPALLGRRRTMRRRSCSSAG
jgi:hypothetical protein